MAAKKKLSKEELRKAMLEAKKKHSSIKKIEHPLARYNELDQLVCILCKIQVRNEAVWPVHLNSKSHKENIEMAKKTKLEAARPMKPPQPVASNKRPATSQSQHQEPKRVKGILKNSGQPPPNVKANLPSDFFDSSSTVSSGSGGGTIVPKDALANGASTTNGRMEVDGSEEKTSEVKDAKEDNQSALPEGFFDDPIQDAKARNVEYKNPIEEEWERFQKEIKEETAQSAQIIGDDQEEAATERQLDVIEEQLRNWSRVMDLVKQKELVKTADKKQDNSDSSSDGEDYDEFLDWRAKKSYRG
ncbi:zinc finger protein 830 [Copidosoma floridanum]|uniref:zinc finger protein 830 n=1 Tax=Copidosoma floridanum TaxID=29053 RepID=UPI0006C96F55|nr:zinc finger protein 830 [Copidosoma floridanum]